MTEIIINQETDKQSESPEEKRVEIETENDDIFIIVGIVTACDKNPYG
jgi:hypothetical protein